MNEEFSREMMLIGDDAMKKLAHSCVMVIGIGGVGSYVTEGLARAGIGKLILIDNDTVSISNINRQLCALHSTIGKYKSQVMAERVLDINPNCEAISLPILYCEDTADSVFNYAPDFIVDAIDTVSAKLDMIVRAQSAHIPMISAMGTGNKFDPSQFEITDISKTINCHLARVMRKELRNRGIYHHTVLFSPELASEAEQAETPPPGRRSVPGSISWVPSCAGLMIAGHVVQKIIHA